MLINVYQLRDYQKQAVENTLHHFRKSRSPAVIVLPTGAGKSLVIAELAQIARGRVLVLTHVKELVEQNYQKYQSYGLAAGIFSASLGQKDWDHKAIFGSVQSVARANDEFFKNFSILIIDECHRVAEDNDSQYQEVISKLKKHSPDLCVLGLTATPYRLGVGWIYEYDWNKEVKSTQNRFFKKCIYELPLSYMIKNKFLTVPVKVDIPVTCYDFSDLKLKNDRYSASEIEDILKNQNRLTPLIIKNIIDITEKYHRQGVMIFSSTIKHAQEIMTYLPPSDSRLVIGETEQKERDLIIEQFKRKEFKYLVNVSVLTTGFDAPHVDVIAILRPTESNSLYQQIVGRGLRLDPGKKDCYILDYTGMGHDLFVPTINDKKPKKDTIAVEVICPQCGFENHFWGYADDEGKVYEHFGRKCRGMIVDLKDDSAQPCGFRFRMKICHQCQAENDITAKECEECQAVLIDADTKLKQAKLSKNAHIMQPEKITFTEKLDKNKNPYLEIRYYDFDGQFLSEAYFFNNPTAIKKFNINFIRSHFRQPELAIELTKIQQIIQFQKLFRLPAYIIARKQEQFWKITEKIFSEEL